MAMGQGCDARALRQPLPEGVAWLVSRTDPLPELNSSPDGREAKALLCKQIHRAEARLWR